MGKIIGQMWYCGDDICDCHQPEIIENMPHPTLRNGIWKTIWSGNFKSEPDSVELKEQWDELIEKCKEMNVDNLKELVEEYLERYEP